MKVDFLIIGQGISGTVIAQTLEQNSQSYFIIDNNINNTSSKIAAGVMHPMSFKRCILNWRGKEFFEFSQEFYLYHNKLLNTKNFKKIKLFRLFSSFEEQNNWVGKSASSIYSSVIGDKEKYFENINNDYGNGEVKKCGHLNVKLFLKSSKNYLEKTKKIITQTFVLKELRYDGNLFFYNGIYAKQVIMCQGAHGLNNKIFGYLPIIANKGELIDVSTKNLPEFMLSKGVFSLPQDKEIFTIGSTYNHADSYHGVTAFAKDQLLKSLEKISSIKDLKIIKQKYGFRPTTIDRKPIIGPHPTIKNMYIFNGMGSKAVLMAPLLAKELIEHILIKKPLDQNVNISRFIKKYSSEHHQFAKKFIKF